MQWIAPWQRGSGWMLLKGDIHFQSVAAEAKVSTAWLVRQEELRARIMRSRKTVTGDGFFCLRFTASQAAVPTEYRCDATAKGLRLLRKGTAN
jgi:hypothetical protein